VKTAALATDPAAQKAAALTLEAHGTATDALIAGFFAAAGARAGVLLAPVQMLTAGPGVGPRAYDGRARQPGRGIPRPRGYLTEQDVPGAARVAAPCSIAMLALAHAGDATLAFSRLVRRGVETAESAGSSARASALRRIAAKGAAALAELARPLVAVAGRAEGGALTAEDLALVRPASARPAVACDAKPGRALYVVPWDAPPDEHRRQEIIVAGDARGVLGVLSYAPDDDGVPIPDLDLLAPRDAAAVRRGVPRLRPGQPLACPGPIALLADRGIALAAFGVASDRALDTDRIFALWQKPAAVLVEILPERAIGVVRSPDRADVRPLRGAPKGSR
jgi:gamma-glutamyltranspeptidase/glutathione hydrolase